METHYPLFGADLYFTYVAPRSSHYFCNLQSEVQRIPCLEPLFSSVSTLSFILTMKPKSRCPPWAQAGELLAAGRQEVSRGAFLLWRYREAQRHPLLSLTSHPSPGPRDLFPKHILSLITSLSTAPTWSEPGSL